MRDIVKDYLDGLIPRRAFMKRMSQAGFGVTAAASALKSLEPLARAQSGRGTRGQAQTSADSSAGTLTTSFEGTGGEMLAEQLRAAGVKVLFPWKWVLAWIAVRRAAG